MKIEEILFQEIGKGNYRFKKVEITSPTQNVAGLTRIDGSYYTKIYPSTDNPNMAAAEPCPIRNYNNMAQQLGWPYNVGLI